MSLDTHKINKFWDWFKPISDNLLDHTTNENLINLLDDQINKLGKVDWEIGPWTDSLQFLAISPNLNIDMLAFTQQVIALAPPCEGWYFLPSKPPKDWKGIWNMKNERGAKILVDTSEWQYILYQSDDETFDIDIKTTEFDANLETQKLAVDIALTGYLGEECFMLIIRDIQIVIAFEDAVKSKATLLRNIKKHVESIQ
jgi:hypothetical protein